MKNENILENFKCPKCGHTKDFLFELNISCRVEDNGIEIDEHAEFNYDGNTWVDCLGCRHTGKLHTFNGEYK